MKFECLHMKDGKDVQCFDVIMACVLRYLYLDVPYCKTHQRICGLKTTNKKWI